MMARLLKGFINPNTKEQDDIDLDAISDIVLLPATVIRSGDTNVSRIHYDLVSEPENRTVALRGIYSFGDINLVSTIQSLSEVTFAHQLAAAYYNHITIDMIPWVSKAKRAAKASICEQLLEYNFLLSDTTFPGIGLITSQYGHRTTTIECLHMAPLIDGTTQVTLCNCVGYIRLDKIKMPIIVFYSDPYQITLDEWKIVEDSETDLRDIKLSVSSFSFTKPCLKPADLHTTINSTQDQEAFISERRAFLNVSTAPRLGFFF